MRVSPIVLATHFVLTPVVRDYDGPRGVESAGQREVEVRPAAPPVDPDAEIAARVAELRRLPVPPSADHEEPDNGRKPLIGGIVFAAAGGIASIVAIAAVVRCAGCDEVEGPLGAGWAATTFFLPTPFLFGVAARRRAAARVHRDAAHLGRTPVVPRRAMAAPGIVLASLGVAALGVSYPLWYTPGIGLRAGGAALAIGGSIWAGRVLGRRQRDARVRRAAVLPMIGPTPGFAVAGRF